jgi:hypothetical protein
VGQSVQELTLQKTRLAPMQYIVNALEYMTNQRAVIMLHMASWTYAQRKLQASQYLILHKEKNYETE